MPYIKPEDRTKYKELLELIEVLSNNAVELLKTAGDLNYFITKICHIYLKNKGLKYQNLNEVIGVLECAKQEFYRKIASPYEDKKRDENGEV